MLLQYQPLTVYNFCFRVKFMSLDRLRSCRCALACLLWPRGPFEAENIFSSEKPPPFDFNSASEKTAKHVKIIVKTRFHSPFYELKRISLCIESPLFCIEFLLVSGRRSAPEEAGHQCAHVCVCLCVCVNGWVEWVHLCLYGRVQAYVLMSSGVYVGALCHC